MNAELEKKVSRAVRLLQSVRYQDGEPIEIAYSGGKDSDVILELAKMAGINYVAIYKNTTIDLPHTISHCKEAGAIIRQPEASFRELIAKSGFPTRHYRFCCEKLKEYKIYYNVVMGIRREESPKRAERYKEPIVCRVFSKKNDIREQCIYPILDWTQEDELEFIRERGIRLHPIYYRKDGTLDLTKRVGCMCCPLQSRRKRLEEFRKYPKMIKFYIGGVKNTYKIIRTQRPENTLPTLTNGSRSTYSAKRLPNSAKGSGVTYSAGERIARNSWRTISI